MTSRLSYLFNRFLEKTATPEEREELFSLMQDDANSAELNLLVETALERDHEVPDLTDEKADMIASSILDADRGVVEVRKKPVKKWMYLAAAACTLIAVSISFFYMNRSKPAVQLAGKDLRNALPGYSNATLILGDGKAVQLDSADQQMIRQGNSTIKSQAGHLLYTEANDPEEVLFNTLITPKGGQYHITLPDKTEVWLNAASSLHYPVTFAGNERTVELQGEGYFEVARDVDKPFYVRTGNTTVQVLGTHFNIMAYENEHTIRATLLEGTVKVTTPKDHAVLSPGNDAIIDPSTDIIKIAAADMDEAVAWKEGYFLFRGANLPAMLRQFERWYNIEIVLKAPRKNYEFVGKIPRTARLSSVLKLLEVNDISYEFDQNKLIIQP